MHLEVPEKKGTELEARGFSWPQSLPETCFSRAKDAAESPSGYWGQTPQPLGVENHAQVLK